MSWFNLYGLIAIIIILIPNIIYAIFNKNSFENIVQNKAIIIFEQIGRFGCMIFMVFNIPYTYFGFWFESGKFVYLIAGGILLLIYCLGWVILFNKTSRLKTLWLSITPTILFLFCGAMITSIPLIVFAIIFGVNHIWLSIANVTQTFC